MAFTVDEFEDLLRLLDQRPEWRAELRRRVLGDDLLELPAILRQLAEAQARTDQQLASVGARLDQLAARFDQHAAQFEQYERRNAIDFQILKNDQLSRRLAALPGIFRQALRDPQPLTPAEADAWLTGLVDRGQLNLAEYRQLLWADLLVRGEREGETGYLVVEVSWTIGPRDVDRAQRHASLLRRIGVPAWPAVVGHRVSDHTRDRLQQEPVVHVIPGPDGDEVEIDEPE